MQGLNRLEQAVLDKLVAGDHPVLVVLQAQARLARLVARKQTCVGFFCDFGVDPSAPLVGGDFEISDVYCEFDGLSGGAGFALFIRAGRLSMLEGATFDGTWPQDVGEFELKYDREPRVLSLPSLPSSPPTAP